MNEELAREARDYVEASRGRRLTVSWKATSPKRPAAARDPHARSSAPNWNNKHPINITTVQN